MVKTLNAVPKTMPSDVRKTRKHSARIVRASISFPSDVYEALETIAHDKKVSLAWVVRDAAGNYIERERSALGKPRPSKER